MSSTSASPSTAAPASPQSMNSYVLTPSRKVQALLAQFDDSDSDTSFSGENLTLNKSPGPRRVSETKRTENPSSILDDDSEEEDVLPAGPRSRIASRLQGWSTELAAHNEIGDHNGSGGLEPDSESDSDKAVAPVRSAMRRRLLTKHKTSSGADDASPARSSASMPLADFASEHIQLDDDVTTFNRGSESHSVEPPDSTGKSKFLALVEKHRQQRLEKEAEEAAKKVARMEILKSQVADKRQPRGSSPADDSDEDSDALDAAGVANLSKPARPTRKASKKAIEEMNRETQRISRNMQLAHQARTKKKITKDSFLARFNFPAPGNALPTTAEPAADNSAPSSPMAYSDTEATKGHNTPPTSPMRETMVLDDPKKSLDTERILAPVREEQNSMIKPNKGKGRAVSAEPFDVQPVLVQSMTAPIPTSRADQISGASLIPSVRPHSSKLSLAAMKTVDSDESDSELEVITLRGDRRKYAAFEHLPKRKAKETPSHLALRSLANLMGSEDRKRSMNAAEMQASLRKAARMQARQERQQKIEELKAKGIVIQTSEEREREQQEVEDLLEKARKEASEIQKREKALAKKQGTYSKDDLDEDDSDDDEDFEEDDNDNGTDEDSDDGEASELEEDDNEGDDMLQKIEPDEGHLLDDEADEDRTDESLALESEDEDVAEIHNDATAPARSTIPPVPRRARMHRIVDDDDEEEEEVALTQTVRSPQLPGPVKTPQTLPRSARKQIPGLQMSDDLPIGLTQAFAATMADSQSQGIGSMQDQDSLTMTMDLPSPNITMVPQLQRLDSIDVITDSQPASQTQPLNINLSFSDSQKIPMSPVTVGGVLGQQFTPSQVQFDPTQDEGYILSPFAGNRFASETPQPPGLQSTIDTVVIATSTQESPVVQRRARLRRGRLETIESEDESTMASDPSAFDVMRRAARTKAREVFDKSKSNARDVVDEAAEESEDEYAGLGGASDDDANDEENEDDRRMIDEDIHVGRGDEAILSKLFADRERQQDEAAVSKLLKDITTGALRRKRGNDDLDLSDEEDAVVRRREAKRREFAKMRRELLKDEAVGKIAEDRKKEAFLRSIEDRPESDDDQDDFNQPETPLEEDSQLKDSQAGNQLGNTQEQDVTIQSSSDVAGGNRRGAVLQKVTASRGNQIPQLGRRPGLQLNRRPGTLAEIRESVSFLIEEPDSQAATIDLGLSDSEDEPEAYVNLDRHLDTAEADENLQGDDDLGDFIVDDDGLSKDDTLFKKPTVPYSESRAPYSERRTKERSNVVNRLTMLRQSSSSSSSSSNGKMAFYSSSSSTNGSFTKVPTLLRRATTNSSLGSMAGRDENVSATGVVTSRTERGKAGDEKEFVRKGSGGRRNAVNYRPTMKEEKMSQRAGITKKGAAKGKKGGGFLGGLFRQDTWT